MTALTLDAFSKEIFIFSDFIFLMFLLDYSFAVRAMSLAGGAMPRRVCRRLLCAVRPAGPVRLPSAPIGTGVPMAVLGSRVLMWIPYLRACKNNISFLFYQAKFLDFYLLHPNLEQRLLCLSIGVC